MLLVSNTLFDFTPLYFRTLIPCYFIFIPLLLVVISESQTLKDYWSVIVVCVFFILYAQPFIKHLGRIDSGKEFASEDYRVVSTVAQVKSLADKAPIYSNEVARLYYLSGGRAAYWMDEWKPQSKYCCVVLFKNGAGYAAYRKQLGTLQQNDFIETDDVLIVYWN